MSNNNSNEIHELGWAHKHPPSRRFRKAIGMVWSASHDRKLKLETLSNGADYPFNIHYKDGKAPISDIVSIDLQVAYYEKDADDNDDYKMIIITQRPSEGQRRWIFTNARTKSAAADDDDDDDDDDLIKNIYKTIVEQYCQGVAQLKPEETEKKIKKLDYTREDSKQVYDDMNKKYKIVPVGRGGYNYEEFETYNDFQDFKNSHTISYLGYQGLQKAISDWNQKQTKRMRSLRGRMRASVSRKPNYRQFAVYKLMKSEGDKKYYEQWRYVRHDILEGFKRSDRKFLEEMKAEDFDVVQNRGPGNLEPMALGGLIFGVGGKKTRKHRRKKGKKSRKHNKKNKHHVRKHKKLHHSKKTRQNTRRSTKRRATRHRR